MKKKEIAIIGCGVIGGAFARFWSKEHSVLVYERSQTRRAELRQSGMQSEEAIGPSLEKAHYLLIAVKPQDLAEVALKVKPYLQPQTWVLSVLAGTSLKALSNHFPKNPILRMMPTVTICEGEGVIGLVDTTEIQGHKEELEKLLQPFGTLHWLLEKKMDAFNALIGSGPAYFYLIAEAMIDAAIAMGIPPKEAIEMLIPLWKGSVTWMAKSHHHPADLKWRVASPGGNTIAGLCEMEKRGVRAGIIQGLLAGFEKVQRMHNIHGSDHV